MKPPKHVLDKIAALGYRPADTWCHVSGKAGEKWYWCYHEGKGNVLITVASVTGKHLVEILTGKESFSVIDP